MRPKKNGRRQRAFEARGATPPEVRPFTGTRELELAFGLDEPDDEVSMRRRIARELRTSPEALGPIQPLKRSIDARRGRVLFRWLVSVGTVRGPLGEPLPKEGLGEPTVLIVGDGPAGLFCAYQLARAGIAARIFDRGKTVQPRRHDLAALNKEGRVDPDSNYCFGEGGAGTYSDGKLYTRAHKRGPVRDVIETLALHGAPESILTDARPHIGSNKLPRVITAMRDRLAIAGTVFEFGSKVVELLVHGRGGERRMVGVRTEDGREHFADHVVLATGHSARDVFELLLRHEVPILPKGFALGVRIEHPQQLVNEIQYGRHASHPRLPNAAYRVVEQVDERGVFSFCMCPGGWIVPASTEVDGLVVNGMSLSRRDSPYANSGLVVGIEPLDWERAGFSGPLGGVQLQRAVEVAAFAAGGGSLVAPATRASDFLARRGSSTVPASSYLPGLSAGNVRDVLAFSRLPLADKLAQALRAFDQRMPGYASSEAVLVATESRTSAPLQVIRHPERLDSPTLSGLYPCGEGAGWAGGIVSAALDGLRVAEAITALVR
jgi:uncharacterized FAD-dependent dehydrogenase